MAEKGPEAGLWQASEIVRTEVLLCAHSGTLQRSKRAICLRGLAVVWIATRKIWVFVLR